MNRKMEKLCQQLTRAQTRLRRHEKELRRHELAVCSAAVVLTLHQRQVARYENSHGFLQGRVEAVLQKIRAHKAELRGKAKRHVRVLNVDLPRWAQGVTGVEWAAVKEVMTRFPRDPDLTTQQALRQVRAEARAKTKVAA